jgi:23S rRNA pseudoU1915 N3-methylase RlmH
MGMYSEGLKLTAAERQKIEDAKDSFDELRFNSENLTKKEITAAKNKVSEVANMTREKHIEALMEDRKIKREDATKIFEATARQMEGNANRAAQLAPTGQMQLALALGGKGGLEAGMRKMADIAAGKFNMQEAYARYLTKEGTMAVSPQEFAAQMRALAPQIRP